MKNKYVLCLLWILIFYSCNNKNQGDILFGFYKIENISNTSIKLENDSILHQVFGLICSNNNLIAYDVDGTYFFSITDLKSNKMLSKAVKQGQGPNEVVGYPQSISLIDKHTFSFFESNKCILYSVNFKDPSYTRLKKKVVLNRDDGVIMSMIPLSPNLYIALGHFEQGRYLLLDKEGKKISYNFEYPKLPNDEMFTNAHKAMAFQGKFMRRPDGERFFFAGTNSEVFEIIEVTKNKALNKIYEFHGEMGDYKPEGDGVNTVGAAISRKSKKKFVSASCTQNYIYLLYSNKIIEDGIYEAYLSNTILVFDWDGNPIKLLKLDTEVSQITVNEEDNTLYGIDPNSDLNLVKFLL